MIKRDEKCCEAKHIEAVKQWCMNKPIKNVMLNIWKLLESLKEMVINSSTATNQP